MNYSTDVHFPSLDAQDRIDLLAEVGGRLREQRERLKLSRKETARRAEVSERFLASVEAGDGNISISRLFVLAHALDLTLEELFRDVRPENGMTQSIALLGIRGAGKSTVGRTLAQSLRVRFIELDELVAKKAGMSLSTVFEIHGDTYFRKLEREALREVLNLKEPIVLATSGSIVTDTEAYRQLRSSAITVWLKARPKDHWDRVVAEGDGRPMSGRTDAMQELRALFDARKALYQRAAHVLDTCARSPREVAQILEEAVREGFRTKHLPSGNSRGNPNDNARVNLRGKPPKDARVEE